MKIKLFLPIVVLAAFLAACDKAVEPASDLETKQWVYDQMKSWYYWNDQITDQPDYTKDIKGLFESLLYKYDATLRPQGDRFSVIRESADELVASLNGESKTTGMEYKLTYYPSGSSNVIGVVYYVLPGSPAAKAGFARGDIFSSVNGQKLTGSNYSQLLNTQDKRTYTLAKINKDGALEEESTTREVTPVVFQEDPVYFDTLFTYGDKRIGYVVYHQFIPGPNSNSESKQYDKKLDEIFGSFKEKNVNALIVDLRYNPGGYVSSATNLASLIAKATSNDVFYYKEYNPQITEINRKKYGEAFFYDKFLSKSQNIGPALNDLVLLTSSRSASASELLINGLKPFMKVTLVGDKTYGKNVGSITINGADKGIKWGMQPIVSKSLNSLRQSDYYKGFAPDVEVKEGIVLYPYGNPKDPLLGEALFQITGMHLTRQAATTRIVQENEGKELVSTIERKAGGSNMFYDK